MRWGILILFSLFIVGCAQTPGSQPIAVPIPENAPVHLSAANIYQNYSGTVYYVKTECVYTYTYPNFFIRSSVNGVWGLIIDLTMIKNDDLKASDGRWQMLSRTNSTKQYGTAFRADNKLFTNNHVVECPDKVVDIVDYFDLNDLSGQDLNVIGDRIYNDQQNFEEVRTSRDVVVAAVNRTVAEHFRSKATFTLQERKVMLYDEREQFKKPILVDVLQNGSSYPDADYAILTPQPGSSLEVGTVDDSKIGDTVYVIGFPFIISFFKPEYHDGMETNPPIITQGVISNRILSENNVSYYVIDAPATFGSSGSPVLSDKGRVIGIMTAGYDNVNLFLPIQDVPK